MKKYNYYTFIYFNVYRPQKSTIEIINLNTVLFSSPGYQGKQQWKLHRHCYPVAQRHE